LIEPSILENKIFKLLGCVFYGNPFHSAEEWSYENEIGKLWQRFGALSFKYNLLLNKICIDNNIAWELHLEPDEYEATKNYFVMVGMEVSIVDEIPLEMFVKILPKTAYLVFNSSMENKFELGAYVYKEWMPKNGYDQAFPYVLQLYDRRRYKGLDDPQSEIDWYIPVKKGE
jgi:AraC family transcriptional regulator